MTTRAARRRLKRTGLAAALSLLVHAGLLFAFLSTRREPPPPAEIQPMEVALVAPGPSAQPKGPATPAPPAAQPPPPRQLARPTKARPDVTPLPAGEGRTNDTGVELSEAQLAGAATAGGGGAGRPCDMARRLQSALRKDSRVQAAVADARGAAGKALYVWNGDWIRSQGQDGNGLGVVREAIMWEVAFAPEACRAEPMHGLLAVSLNDGSGSARLVLGAGDWHWKDLLRPR
jgi:type IV secretory pathway VirB10-like protein